MSAPGRPKGEYRSAKHDDTPMGAPAPLFHAVAHADEVAPGSVLRVEVAGRAIALFNLGGEFFATDDTCTHMRGRLSDGYVEGGVIECPLHSGRFDIKSGRALSAPCTVGLKIYEVRVFNEKIEVTLTPAG